MNIDEKMKTTIMDIFVKRLDRNLTVTEEKKVNKARSLLGYESIIDWISSKEIGKSDIEEYLRKLT
jgi:hypothetical protein